MNCILCKTNVDSTNEIVSRKGTIDTLNYYFAQQYAPGSNLIKHLDIEMNFFLNNKRVHLCRICFIKIFQEMVLTKRDFGKSNVITNTKSANCSMCQGDVSSDDRPMKGDSRQKILYYFTMKRDLTTLDIQLEFSVDDTKAYLCKTCITSTFTGMVIGVDKGGFNWLDQWDPGE